jgi:hypothetical protein
LEPVVRLRRSLIFAPLAAALLLAFTALPAAAKLLIAIDKSSQRMTVSLDGVPMYHWPVSTGIRRYDTPAGAFTPFRMEQHHFSREWDDAPMPHSIFFTKVGHAIHGTNHLSAIGRPASHGCVRLQPQNARVLFSLVKREGMANTRVVLTGETPDTRPPAVARRTPDWDRPVYDNRDDTFPDGERRAEREYLAEPRPARGYWVQYPDGRREWHEGEYHPPPPWRGPFFFPGGRFERN